MREITPDLVRAGRGLAGLNIGEFAERAGVRRATLADFENGKRTPQPSTLRIFAITLEEIGIELEFGTKLRGRGVYWSKNKDPNQSAEAA